VVTAPVLAQVTINPLPTREFGQPTLQTPLLSAAPNLVEGRELYNPSGIAFDNSVTPPRVYIADTGNNRVLGWSNANNLTQGNFADLVIGQPGAAPASFYSTFPQGPSTSLSTGLNGPTGIAVDGNGNVYVADSGNNRILRFKTPYQQQAGNLVVDLVIGQKSVTSSTGSPNNQANQGNGANNPSASSVYFTIANSAGLILPAGLALDASGNLWISDPGNNRVLGFPPSSLAAGTVLPAANVVLGQNSFTANQAPSSQSNLGLLLYPTSVAVDTQGNLYVADGYARTIQYAAPLVTGKSGSKVLGIPPTQTTTATYPTASTLGAVNSSGGIIGSPQGVFVLNGAQGASVFVCDSPQNRVVLYSNLTIPASANSPLQTGVTGQSGSFTSGQVNQGQPNPSNQSFSYPIAGAINPANNEMWIVDQGNNRVIAFANQGGGVYTIASRVIGQKDFIYGAPNLIEGRELSIGGFGSGVAIDGNSNPPHLYVADSLNNRILAFKDARNVGTNASNILNQTADLVIGQADLFHNLVNYPKGAQGQPTATGLSRPVGLAVDSNGNLWVADSGNGRAVRFPAPFGQPAGTIPTATMVLGQPDFVTANLQVTPFNMYQPYGLTIFSDSGAPGSGSLAVSDIQANRVLVFTRPSGGDFTSGQQAQFVVGQPNFSQAVAGNGSSQLNSPRGLAVDSGDRLYVCDSGNNRLIVFSKPTASTPSATALVNGLSAPQGVAVSFLTGRSWVTNTTANPGLVYQLPEFNILQNTQAPTQAISSYGPLAVALDPFDDVIVADSANRVTFYFGQLYYRNTASYASGVGLTAGPTPGMLVAVALENSSFKLTPSYTGAVQNLNPPWPTTPLNDLQVTVAGYPAAIFRIDPAEILFEIPNAAPQSGPADFIVTHPSTGQVLAVNTFTMQPASPGLYTLNSSGTGLVAANVYDSKMNCLGNCVNSSSNPVSAGGIIGLWLTGAGYVPNLPPDGVAPGTGKGPQFTPTVLINGEMASVVGSGISPQFPGVWQVNVVVPLDTPSSTITPISVVVKLDDYQSNIGGNTGFFSNGSPLPDMYLLAAGGGGNGLITTIYVK
jgi:uncharacterized protein (TIGR03437 family)